LESGHTLELFGPDQQFVLDDLGEVTVDRRLPVGLSSLTMTNC